MVALKPTQGRNDRYRRGSRVGCEGGGERAGAGGQRAARRACRRSGSAKEGAAVLNKRIGMKGSSPPDAGLRPRPPGPPVWSDNQPPAAVPPRRPGKGRKSASITAQPFGRN